MATATSIKKDKKAPAPASPAKRKEINVQVLFNDDQKQIYDKLVYHAKRKGVIPAAYVRMLASELPDIPVK